jgi:heat shock protein HtpX
MAKRLLLFVVTNLAVVLVLGVVLRVLGLDRVPVGPDGSVHYSVLLAGSAIIGFFGALVSLAMSKTLAKMSTGAVVLVDPRTPAERQLLQTVSDLATRAGIGMPEVAVYPSPDVNAFATGMFRNKALVAVSTGLLDSLPDHEVRAVLGHEIAHVANGDMVTMALLQGVLNTFVVFLSRLVGFFVDAALSGRSEERRSGPSGISFVVTIVLQMTLGILASMVIAWFSRRREFRADAGSARLLGDPRPMRAALLSLRRIHEPAELPPSLQAFAIRGRALGRVARLFASHPPIEERIARLSDGVPTRGHRDLAFAGT